MSILSRKNFNTDPDTSQIKVRNSKSSNVCEDQKKGKKTPPTFA